MNGLVARYRSWKAYRRTYEELMRLSNRELQDLGLNRSDIALVAKGHYHR